MSDDQARIERRRNRGRAAQSAFRKRQSQARQDMLEENSRLKQALESIMGEISENDRPALRSLVRDAAELAGVRPGPGTPASGGTRSRFRISNIPFLDPHSSATSNLHSASALREDGWLAADSEEARADQVSALIRQRLPHTSVSRDPFQYYRCEHGAATVLPFLGMGALTISGRIFWHLTEKFEAALYGDLISPRNSLEHSTTAAEPPPRLVDLLRRSKSMQHTEPYQWIAMVDERVDLARREAARDGIEHPSRLETLQFPIIDHDTPSSTGSGIDWLSPITAEKRIREIVGDDVFAVLATPALDRWEARHNHRHESQQSEGADLIESFLDILSNSFVCFGDGPRWARAKFDDLLRAWCLSLIDKQAVQG
ncbi:uncharacterized protein E0L32_001676 [Thyridium curvatum]|uniref:BZIP domain-containing protein n=1 Tax=Thyridium curvatum TaxID=1093900 RepID=A0A507AR98_9PEZI|nr:uncharacterized protein E0L32_001522 [Thyridium curvatum]XP_030990927.1 uncharacterized protein E0L32_001676 [Thyridium curvatum]TPX09062.1 hypothetical protein E0L32_001522 [Thyridium curvatum]TPX09216.1 hypothetical protein E0L32_001676 [Thyridium curvatum]